MDTEGVEAGTVQLHSREKQGTRQISSDSDEEAIVDFVKDHKEFYHKTHEQFKDKTRKECLWERFTNSCKL